MDTRMGHLGVLKNMEKAVILELNLVQDSAW